MVLTPACEFGIASMTFALVVALSSMGDAFWWAALDDPTLRTDQLHGMLCRGLCVVLAAYAATLLAPRVRAVQVAVWLAFAALLAVYARILSDVFLWLAVTGVVTALASLAII